MPDTDAALIACLDRIAAGDSAALKTLYDRCAGRLYGLALSVVRDAETAQDVLQESFVQIWRSAADYRAALSPPLAWLGLIVRSRALDALRRRKAARLHEHLPLHGDDEHEGLSAVIADPGAGPDENLHSSQLARALQGCLSKLEQKQRQVLALAYLRELSHSELAEQLALPLGTVKTWIRRGLEQLRGCMHACTKEVA